MILIEPETADDFRNYFELRWRILRKTPGEPRGSEQDDEEDSAYHIMSVENLQAARKPVAVARLQFIEPALVQLRYMAVEDTLQHKGIGKAIVKHMENYAREKMPHNYFYTPEKMQSAFIKIWDMKQQKRAIYYSTAFNIIECKKCYKSIPQLTLKP